MQGGPPLTLVQDHVYARRLQQLTDESFVYLSDNDINRVQIHYMSHQVSTLFSLEAISEGEHLKTMNYDATHHKIAIVVQLGKKPEAHQSVDKRELHLRLFDVARS